MDKMTLETNLYISNSTKKIATLIMIQTALDYKMMNNWKYQFKTIILHANRRECGIDPLGNTILFFFHTRIHSEKHFPFVPNYI